MLDKTFWPAAALAASAIAGYALAAPAGRTVGYTDGVVNAEDLVGIPGTPWIITGGLGHDGQPGSLFLIDRRTKTASALQVAPFPAQFDKQAYPECPGPYDGASFSAHGVTLRKGPARRHTFYAINHGGREAIEVFALDATTDRPTITWSGCIPLPEGVLANGVAPLPRGGVVVSHMTAPRYFRSAEEAKAPAAWTAKFVASEPTGHVARWRAGSGWITVPGTEASGPNGVEASADGKTMWIANFASHELVRIAERPDGQTRRAVVPLGFMPDNLKWGDDGWLWIVGAAMSAADYFACAARPGCGIPYRIARVHPKTLKLEAVTAPDTRPGFGNATTALQLGREVWLGTHPSKRVAYLNLDPAPR